MTDSARAAGLGLGLVLAVPVAAGLGFAVQSGITSLPDLIAWQGLPRAALLSLGPGLAATATSVFLVLVILGLRPAALVLLERLLAPMLALTLGLVLKETPFLLLMALGLAARHQERLRMVAATLGYGRAIGFALAVWPSLYPQVRLPVLAVLVYAMTNVDMALILGPGLPHPLAVQISLWMTEPSLAHQGLAAAGALVQLALVVFGLAIWRGAEALGHRWLMALTQGGVRGRGLDVVLGPLAAVAAAGLALVAVMGLAGLALWSLAGPWPFPLALPRALGLTVWARAAPDLARTTATSLALAGTTTLAAVLLTLAALQGEGRDNRVRRVEALVYLPLIVPQVVFLPGIAVALLTLPVPPVLAVAAAHLVFVLPYVFLSLAGPFRAWDGRMGAVATTLGAGPWRILLRLRLPMLAAPLAAAAAIGVAVSIGQYLPTLLLGGGRVATLTTEAVALASGSNRRIVGAYGLMQAVWPALAFALARRVKAA